MHHTTEHIAAMHAAIKSRAWQLKAMGGEVRTLAQLEADVAHDLLVGTDPHTGRVVEVHLAVPATTAVSASDEPGEVDGLPVTAQPARELMVEATTWRWVRIDPTPGDLPAAADGRG